MSNFMCSRREPNRDGSTSRFTWRLLYKSLNMHSRDYDYKTISIN